MRKQGLNHMLGMYKKIQGRLCVTAIIVSDEGSRVRSERSPEFYMAFYGP